MRLRVRTLTQLSILCACALLLSVTGPVAAVSPAPQKMTADEVVAKHLESIGPADVRAQMKSYVILGQAVGTFRLGGSGTSSGGSVMASQGTMNLIAIIYGNQEYPFEKLGFDGSKLTVGEYKPGKRSTLAQFFMTHEMPLREGLMGGALSAAWPLLNTSAMKGKLKYAGTKKVGDIKAHVLEYDAKDSTGFDTVRLYFDAGNFHHLKTEYEQRLVQQMPSQPSVTQQQNESITKLVEEFSDFKPEGGLTLPHQYKIQLSIEALNRRVLQDWVFTLTGFTFNRDINRKEFDVSTPSGKS